MFVLCIREIMQPSVNRLELYRYIDLRSIARVITRVFFF